MLHNYIVRALFSFSFFTSHGHILPSCVEREYARARVHTHKPVKYLNEYKQSQSGTVYIFISMYVFFSVLCVCVRAIFSRFIRAALFSFAIWLSLLFVLLLNIISLISFIHWSIHSFTRSFIHTFWLAGRPVVRSFLHSFLCYVCYDCCSCKYIICGSQLQQQKQPTAAAATIFTSLYIHIYSACALAV